MLGDVFFQAFMGIFDHENKMLGLAMNARALEGSEMICFGKNDCSQPITPSPTPTPPTPMPTPDNWAAPGNIPVMVTDGFLLVLVLLVLGAFIYCFCSKKKEQENVAVEEQSGN